MLHRSCSATPPVMKSTSDTSVHLHSKIIPAILIACLHVLMPATGACVQISEGRAEAVMPAPAHADSHTPQELNAIAWRFYKNSKYRQAEIFFKSALKSGATGETKISVLLGLGYTELKLQRPQQARKYFTMAAELAPSIKGGDMDRAEEGIFLSAMSEGDAAKAWSMLKNNSEKAWTSKFRKLEIEIPLCVKAADTEGAMLLVEKYHDDPAVKPGTDSDKKKKEIYLSLLYFLSEKKASGRLLCTEMLNHGLPQKQVTACLHGLRNRDRAASAALGRKARKAHPEWFKKKKKTRPVITDAMRAGQAFQKKDYTATLSFCEKALEKQPGNLNLISMAAWSAFHLKQWSIAEKWFRTGINIKKSQDMRNGLCWTLIRQKRCAECTELISPDDAEKSEQLRAPLLEALRCQGMAAYRSANWESAIKWFDKFLAISPKPDAGILEMRAWAYYRAERWEDADRAFASLLEQEQREAWINARAYCLARQGKSSRVIGLYEQYHGDPCRSGDLAGFLYSAGISQNNICRTAGCENYFAAGLRYRNRSGDNGQGRLDDWGLPALYARYRLSDKVLFRANGAFRHVSNHRHSDDFQDGYFSFLYEPVSILHISAGAGFSGIGALVGARPLWHAGAKVDTRAGSFTLTGYRSTVDDSLLSISGMKAGHDAGINCENNCCTKCENCRWNQHGACDEFGGVSRTGAYVSWAGDISRFNLNALLDFEQLTGTKVRRNHRYLANFSAGTTIPIPRSWRNHIQPLWGGMYATWFRYERNLNFYTCGNGGYFSPRSFIASGPVINMRTVEGRCWIASIDASTGYVNYIEDDGWQYPRESGMERGCWYDGRSLNLLGYGIHGRGAYRLNRYLALEARGGVDRSANFTEWGAALNLIIYPDRVAGLFFQGLPEAVPWLP